MIVVTIQGGTSTFVKVAGAIGRNIQAQVQIQKLKKDSRSRWKMLRSSESTPSIVIQNARKMLNDSEWTTSVHVRQRVEAQDLSALCGPLVPKAVAGSGERARRCLYSVNFAGWMYSLQIKLGSCLLDLLVKTATVHVSKATGQPVDVDYLDDETRSTAQRSSAQ